MRISSLFAALVVLVSACASPDAPARDERTAASAPAAAPDARPASAGERPRIVFLGDSLTAGLGLQKDQAVPALVQQRLDSLGFEYEVVNAGVSGDTSAGGLSRLDWSLEGDVRVLVIELGANDGLRGNSVDGMKRNLDEIIRRAKAKGIKVLLTGMEAPPNFGQAYTNEFRRVFVDLAREHDVAFMPFFLDGVAGIPALNNADGIHPNPEGARLVERTLWPTLEPLLEKQG
jgi:acyl-CoA thioesterase-1